jgi:hypothetical protein
MFSFQLHRYRQTIILGSIKQENSLKSQIEGKRRQTRVREVNFLKIWKAGAQARANPEPKKIV